MHNVKEVLNLGYGGLLEKIQQKPDACDNTLPQDIKIKYTNAIRVGFGRPKLFNDEVCIPSMARHGRSLEDAKNYGGAEKGMDVSAGGAIYNYSGPQAVGVGTLAGTTTKYN